MALTRRSLLRASALTAGALTFGGVTLARPLGVLGQPLGTDDADGTSRVSRLFGGQRLVHADLHNHTIFSDADPGATAELAYATMEEGGMDVAALTDHASVSWAPGGVPSEFPCPPDEVPTFGEGCRSVFGLSNEEWEATGDLAQAFTVTQAMAQADPALREYLGVRGFEWSSPTLGHMNVWFSQQFIDPLHTGGISGASTAADFVHEGRDADPTGVAAALEEVLRTSAQVVDAAGMVGFQRWLSLPSGSPVIGGGADGIAGFNHPGREADRFGDFEFEPAIRDNVVSLELFNRKEDYLFELLDVARPSALVQCLAQGWRPGILGVSDQHDPIKRKESDIGQGRGGLWVGELSDVGVKEAMRQRRFFATRIKGLRFDAAANGVRMGQPFAHPGGRVLVQLDLATGTEHAGRTLNCHVIAAPVDGGLLPEILAAQVITLPTDVIEIALDVDPERHPWIAVRVSEPGPTSGEGLGFGPDGRAAGTPYEPLGAAWVYSSPWYFDAAAPPAPPAGRAPLTVQEAQPGGDGSGGGGTGGGGAGGGGTDGDGTSGGGAPTPTPTPSDPGADQPVVNPVVGRRAGPDRIGTAVELSRGAFVAGVDTAFVAAADRFPDALSGSAAAATVPGPILLVPLHTVPQPVVDELERLQARRVVILGGPAAVGPTVEVQLRGIVEEVVRIAGDDRFATSAAVSRAFFTAGTEEVWVASGETPADALPGGPAAAQVGGPLLLVAQGAVPDVIDAELRRLAPERIVLLGGTDVLDAEVESTLRGIAPVTRIAGASRFDTAALISQRSSATAQRVVVASGRAFADALAAGPVAFLGTAPILLVEPDAIPDETDAEIRRLKPEVITIAGGTAAVSAEVEAQLRAYDIGGG